MEPRARVELATCRLRIGCSTTELPRLRLIRSDLLTRVLLTFVNCHQIAIKVLLYLGHRLAQIRRVHDVVPMLYLSNVDSVRCPEIFMAILRHSTLALTMNIYVKSVNESQTVALDSLSERMGQTDVIQ